ncbi:GtrA family protein [Lactobacillus sp. CC-MHH1034]|uniref:GtrA family protein n=1 Tax=Agrilactobacillus fermenti TaxID=2586909 RepID=UPI001E412B59|nr:GtrA family protein [Agrilactobacillus fermenti]MCD2255169.1 GtrA family protein [Agrilactobacillus fermenti]
MAKLRQFYLKHQAFFLYMIFGFLGSVVNIVSYWLLAHFFRLPYILANSIAWVLGLLFSFFTNKSLVFKSRYSNSQAFFKEFLSFLLSRIFSFFVDNLTMFIGISLLHLPSIWAKIIDQLIVGLLNYGTSVLVFQKDKRKMRAALDRSRRRFQQKKR